MDVRRMEEAVPGMAEEEEEEEEGEAAVDEGKRTDDGDGALMFDGL